MKNFFFFLVTLFVINFHCQKTDAMNIQCEFKNHNVYGYGYKKGCEVRSVTWSSSKDREITNVNGDFETTYNDVWWIQLYSKTFIKFPKNIKKIFPNVEVVSISTTNIAILTKSDMAPLGSQLKRFDFHGNKIEVLEEGLFDENPNLERINLGNNKIKFVASGVFDKLPELTTLYFKDNPCHSGYVYNDRAAVLNLISEIKEKCQNVQTTTSTTEKVKPEHELRIEELTAENAELKRHTLEKDTRHQEELQKLQECKAEASIKDDKNKDLEMQIEILRKKLAAVEPCDELHEVRDSIMNELKGLKMDLHTTNDKIDAKLDSTLVKPMSSLHAKMDSTDGKCASMISTCNSLDYKLGALKCVRMP